MSDSHSMDDIGVDLESLLLKPFEKTAKHTFKGWKSLALHAQNSWDEIVYADIKRVFKYKEFKKNYQFIIENESHLINQLKEIRHNKRVKPNKAYRTSYKSNKKTSKSSKSSKSSSRSSTSRGKAHHSAPSSTVAIPSHGAKQQMDQQQTRYYQYNGGYIGYDSYNNAYYYNPSYLYYNNNNLCNAYYVLSLNNDNEINSQNSDGISSMTSSSTSLSSVIDNV